jgi:hypothetical protein
LCFCLRNVPVKISTRNLPDHSIGFLFQHASVIDVEAIEEIVALTNQTVYANQPAQRQVGARDKAWFALDSPLEGAGFEPSVPIAKRDASQVRSGLAGGLVTFGPDG